MSMAVKTIGVRTMIGVMATLALSGLPAYENARAMAQGTEACLPLSGEEASDATRAPDIEDACATAAAIINAALGERGATPGATPAEVPAGEVAVSLPPADIPSTNERGYSYQLEASLSASLDNVPVDAPVYRLVTEQITESEVAALAERLDLTGDVEVRGDDVFAVSGNGDLFVAGNLIQYLAIPSPEPGELPSDEQAVTAARDWLVETGLAPPDLGSGEVVTRSSEVNRVVVQFDPIQPERLLAAYPTVVVTLGSGDQVVEARLQWPTIERHDLYRLRPAESAWRDVEAGRAYIEVPLEGADIEQGSEITGTVLYDEIAIGYTTSGPPGGEQYLQPVFIFSGQLTPEGSTESYPASAYVPALPSSGTPVG
jgi:hypothetical protein